MSDKTPTPAETAQLLALDFALYGVEIAIRRPDGTMERIDPRTVTLTPNGDYIIER
jgi:hypothetical protein